MRYQASASRTPFATAREEIVAAVIASTVPPSFFSRTASAPLPRNWSRNAASVTLTPRPGVSVWSSFEIASPATVPSGAMPIVMPIGPA